MFIKCANEAEIGNSDVYPMYAPSQREHAVVVALIQYNQNQLFPVKLWCEFLISYN